MPVAYWLTKVRDNYENTLHFEVFFVCGRVKKFCLREGNPNPHPLADTSAIFKSLLKGAPKNKSFIYICNTTEI